MYFPKKLIHHVLTSNASRSFLSFYERRLNVSRIKVFTQTYFCTPTHFICSPHTPHNRKRDHVLTSYVSRSLLSFYERRLNVSRIKVFTQTYFCTPTHFICSPHTPHNRKRDYVLTSHVSRSFLLYYERRLNVSRIRFISKHLEKREREREREKKKRRNIETPKT